MQVASIDGVSGVLAGAGAERLPSVAAGKPQAASFGELLINGVEQVNSRVLDAEGAVRAFVLDDSVPIHQVTYALEHARLSFELMMQVRSRLLEGYQELMRMQL